MVLSDVKIKELVKEHGLLSPFDERKLQATSYDISSSSEVMVYCILDYAVDLRNRDHVETAMKKVNIGNGYHVKPGEYILVKTKEKVNMPDTLAAHIRPRTTFTRLGLIVSDQHINPSFQGYLYLGIHNVTPNIIDIYPDLSMAQVIFEKVDGPITQDRLYRMKQDAKYQGEDDFRVPKYDMLENEEKEEVDNIINKILGRTNV